MKMTSFLNHSIPFLFLLNCTQDAVICTKFSCFD